ncbi:unnamed protein product [Rodentolepis nana]|uniref:Annexin n=1 Tax=Rodentolepis nana TaxID=102285 RepID=A0A0R3T8P7_RODNA|nr:unnamed protein product [Rodentolepis nana]
MTSDFDPVADAMALNKAMKGLGTDEKAIIDILANRTFKQRKKIAKRYKASFGQDLQKRLSQETSGKFRKVVKMSFLDRAHLNAKALFKAMDGMGTKESVIIQVLCTASNEEIAELRDAYEKALRRDIEKDIISDLSGDFEKFIVAILQGAREEALDRDAAAADVEALYNAGEKKIGTDEEVFTRIFARNSYETLRLMDELYFEKAGHGLLKAIASELSGDYEKAITTVVKTAFKKEECIADFLYEAMSGLGTKDEQLMRLLLAYSEDNMTEIKAIFMAKYKKSLEQRIHSDTSGDYRKFLIALVSKY